MLRLPLKMHYLSRWSSGHQGRSTAVRSTFTDSSLCARLGLGAPLPTKSSAKDEYKLRKTLSGKPALVDGSKLSEGKIGNLVDDPDISDDDSKSRIMSTKVPLHDVLALFEKGQSKKKKKRKKRPVITLDCLPNEVTAEEWNGIQFDRESTGASPIPEDLTSRFDSSGTHQIPHLLPNQSIVSDSSTLGESSRSSPTATLSPPSSLSSLRKSSNDPSLQRDGSPALLRGASLSDIPPPKKKRRKRSKVLGDTRAGVHSK